MKIDLPRRAWINTVMLTTGLISYQTQGATETFDGVGASLARFSYVKPETLDAWLKLYQDCDPNPTLTTPAPILDPTFCKTTINTTTHLHIQRILALMSDRSSLFSITHKGYPYAYRKIISARKSRIISLGDLHGDIRALLCVLKKLHADGILTNELTLTAPRHTRLAFLGDFIDRGRFGIEVTTLLCQLYNAAAKTDLVYDGPVLLLRGNHETGRMCYTYGFGAELHRKYHNKAANILLQDVFLPFTNTLPAVAYLGVQAQHSMRTLLTTTGKPRRIKTNKTFYLQLCHGGSEIGWNPLKFLEERNSNHRITPILALHRINNLLRMYDPKATHTQAVIDRAIRYYFAPVMYPIEQPEDQYPLSQAALAYQYFQSLQTTILTPEHSHLQTHGHTAPSLLGFCWSDYASPATHLYLAQEIVKKDRSVTHEKRAHTNAFIGAASYHMQKRGIAYGSTLMTALPEIRAAQDPKHTACVVVIQRGHQHNDTMPQAYSPGCDQRPRHQDNNGMYVLYHNKFQCNDVHYQAQFPIPIITNISTSLYSDAASYTTLITHGPQWRRWLLAHDYMARTGWTSRKGFLHSSRHNQWEGPYAE